MLCCGAPHQGGEGSLGREEAAWLHRQSLRRSSAAAIAPLAPRSYLMRRLLTTLATGVFACATLRAATIPPSETVIPDVPRLIERAKAGPYGRIWNHPDIAPLRSLVETQLNTLLQNRGPQVWEVLADVRSVIIRGSVQPDLTNGPLSSTIAMHLPMRGEQAITLLKELLPKDAQAQPIQRIGEWLVIGPAPSDASSLVVVKSED